MRRDLYALTRKEFDVLVVGGGITGACIARDAALRGLSVALVEKGDFSCATSAASSKLIHGGLRYLQNLELGLVREALRERRIWSNIAPHLVDPLTFMMPITNRRIGSRLKMALGLTAYDWLAYDRNRALDDPEKAIPSHSTLGREETLKLEPNLDSEDLNGARLFYDYQMYSPERLALECIHDAAAHGGIMANYARMDHFLVEDGIVRGAHIKDSLVDNFSFDVRAKLTVNAAGPWADLLMDQLNEGPPVKQLIRSKGIHLLTRPLTNTHGVAVPTDEGHFFILPWRGYSILGTTDTVFTESPDDFYVSEEDIGAFLETINKGFPAANLTREDVLHFYGGLRPIVDNTTDDIEAEGDESDSEEKPDSYTASRAAEIYDHESEAGLKGVITTIGGKWTTSRSLAAQVVDLAVKKLDRDVPRCSSDLLPTHGGDVGPFADFLGRAIVKYSALPEPVIENLAKNYGGCMEAVLDLEEEDPALITPICDHLPDIGAQVVYAVRTEMALTVEDVLFRRTGLGTIGPPGEAVIQRVADLMAGELEWDAVEKTRQVEAALASFEPGPKSAS